MAIRPAEPRRAAAHARGEPPPFSHLERGRLAAEILTAYLRVRLALRRAPIAAVLARLRSHGSFGAPPPPRDPAGCVEEARRLGRAVTRMLVLVPGDTRCLVRSLVLARLLAARGMPAQVVIGARTDPGFLAHAWVECGCEPVLSPGDGSFARLVEL